MKNTTLALITSLSLMSAPLVDAVSVSTSPVGFINLTVKGGGFSALSVPMLTQVEYSGVISSTNTNVIVDDAATWSTNQFVEADMPSGSALYYAEITANSNDASTVGTILEIFANDAATKSLTVGADVSGLEGASYVIRKFRTLGDVFGTNNESGLASGASLSDADVIFKVGLDDQSKPVWIRYYYQVDPSGGFLGGTGWRSSESSSEPMHNAVIFPDEGLLIKRSDSSDLTITLPGAIKTNSSKTPILSGFNLVAFSFPVDRTLEELGIKDILQSGASLNDSDVIYVVEDNGQLQRYYYQTDPSGGFLGGTGWRSAASSSADVSNKLVSAGTSLIVYRQPGGDSLKEWNTDVPF